MKILKKVVLWPISAFMLLSSFVFLPSFASVMMILTSALTLPFDKWQKLLDKTIRKKCKMVLAIVFAVAAFALAPVEDVPDEVVNNITPSTEESIASTTIPAVKVENIVAATEETEETRKTTEPSEQPAEHSTSPQPETEPYTEPATEPIMVSPTETPTDSPVIATTAPADLYDYDPLQTIFLTITPETSIEEIEAFIADYELCYTRKEYNKSGGGKSISYKIAFTNGSAKQSHAESGDYLDVDFDKASGTLMTAQYVKSGTSGSALLYCYGTWFDFSDANAEDYAGYYLIDMLSKELGITIKYKNGNEAETNYFPHASAEELIQYLINIEE